MVVGRRGGHHVREEGDGVGGGPVRAVEVEVAAAIHVAVPVGVEAVLVGVDVPVDAVAGMIPEIEVGKGMV